jgi:hypothetical protein
MSASNLEPVMTRMFRAIPLPCVRLILLSAVAASVLLCASDAAFAGVSGPIAAQTNDRAMDDAVDGNATADDVANSTAADELSTPDDEIPPASSADAAPAIETPLHHFYCVEYARLRSGFAIFGDAKTWWGHAKNIYDEVTAPVADAVMVFSGSKRITRGHVAFVTQIVGPREIRVDQANWQNHGEIDRNTPVLDVSAGNDWSKVRVWNIDTGQFGAHVYAISGFIARSAAAATGS